MKAPRSWPAEKPVAASAGYGSAVGHGLILRTPDELIRRDPVVKQNRAWTPFPGGGDRVMLRQMIEAHLIGQGKKRLARALAAAVARLPGDPRIHSFLQAAAPVNQSLGSHCTFPRSLKPSAVNRRPASLLAGFRV